MTIYEVKQHMNKKVLYTNESLYLHDKVFILNAIISKLDKIGNWVYSVELLDPDSNSTLISTLEKIEKGME